MPIKSFRRLQSEFVLGLKPRKLTKIEKTWIACAIDTEGCITLKARANYPKAATISLAVTNTNLAFLNKIQQIVGKGIIRQNPNKRRKTVCFRWILTKLRDVSELLEEIYPYLIIKKPDAERLILFSKIRHQLGAKRLNTPYNAFEKYLMEGGE